MLRLGGQSEQIQDRRRDIDDTGDALDARTCRTRRTCRPDRRFDQQRHSDVFFKKEYRVAKISYVLSERLGVIADDDIERVLVETARLESVDEGAERAI